MFYPIHLSNIYISSRAPFTYIPSHNGFSQASKPIALLSEVHKLLSQSICLYWYFLSDALAPFLQQDISYNPIPFECSAPRTVPQTWQSG